jgi:hypothetical protein
MKTATQAGQWRVAWRIPGTDARGHGIVMDKWLVDAWVDWANTKHPNILHWAERVLEPED